MLEGLANSIAVLLSIWVGIHYRAPQWLAIYGSAAVASAALPAHRFVGVIALAVGLAVAVSAGYLLMNASISPADVISPAGGLASPAREAVVAGITALWLIVASLIRLRRP